MTSSRTPILVSLLFSSLGYGVGIHFFEETHAVTLAMGIGILSYLYVTPLFCPNPYKLIHSLLHKMEEIEHHYRELHHQIETLRKGQAVTEKSILPSEYLAEELVAEIDLLKDLLRRVEDAKSSPPVPSMDIPSPPPSEQKAEILKKVTITPTNEDIIITPDGAPLDFSREAILEAIQGALEHDRVDLWLQPIVSLPQRKPRYYECYSRIRDKYGVEMVPDHFLETAAQEGLIGLVDNALLFRCIQLVRRAHKQDYSVRFFCNITEETLRNRHFVETFVEFIRENQGLATNIIFEFDIALLSKDSEILQNLKRLSAFGGFFSVQDVKSIHDIDPNHLKQLRVKFIKIDSDVLLHDARQDVTRKAVHTLKRKLDAHYMDLIVTKIEEEKTLIDLLEFQIDYGQGFLFSPLKKGQS